MDEPMMHWMSEHLASLKERMNTHQAKYEGALDRFRTDMAKTDSAFERLRADMEKRDAETARRESKHMQWLIGLWTGGVIVAVAVFGTIYQSVDLTGGNACNAPTPALLN